jgi:hypothetical protein
VSSHFKIRILFKYNGASYNKKLHDQMIMPAKKVEKEIQEAIKTMKTK